MPKKIHGSGHGSHSARLRKNHCFACGPDNPAGMHLKFIFNKKRNRFVCRFRLDERYTGPPGHCHGGIIATILDEAMGKVNKLREVIALTCADDGGLPASSSTEQAVAGRVAGSEFAAAQAHEYGRDSEPEGRSPGPRSGIIRFRRCRTMFAKFVK